MVLVISLYQRACEAVSALYGVGESQWEIYAVEYGYRKNYYLPGTRCIDLPDEWYEQTAVPDLDVSIKHPALGEIEKRLGKKSDSIKRVVIVCDIFYDQNAGEVSLLANAVSESHYDVEIVACLHSPAIAGLRNETIEYVEILRDRNWKLWVADTKECSHQLPLNPTVNDCVTVYRKALADKTLECLKS
ncbi:hypothetical protein BOW37_11555 [Solemya velum gill symbiont]|uniref:hypothetical protein n=1 Tax=Solemya velum gill symbiont TaxID=2340 RepID=UPI00099896C4|nr:hypothetical protein [Solemya velum gill symbiont]OOZ43288.1 hypothetical protein BOW37_11555 [Solemya velum gill symbiont]OOZ44282.1 hypothetical protein BOW38_11650 [Solemya velum gill symbiont]OOZ48053.1 hypothetical protein BOW39_12560 [Solemya velum gill symbiont]OOZ49534.1 hypothetical protein BOW40_11590 [Solemya velum gill symbiont]OOZ53073.1 hypothetical protein BOW41_11740 [Solemya velum gill symbiont]